MMLESIPTSNSQTKGEDFEPPALIPPLRFGCVNANIYRGSYPQVLNERFLRQLSLKTIVSITPEPIDIDLPNVELIHIPCVVGDKQKSKKKRGVPITSATALQAIQVLENPEKQPVYIHCLNGSQITCLVVACLRRRQNWSMTAILSELERYGDYDRADVVFIEELENEVL